MKWKGHKTVTWEPPSNFNLKECLQDYWGMREKGKERAVMIGEWETGGKFLELWDLKQFELRTLELIMWMMMSNKG